MSEKSTLITGVAGQDGACLTARPRRTSGAESLYCRLQFSALELDDTRKPLSYREAPRRFRFSIGAM